MVYGVNGVTGFMEGFIQMTIILVIMGLFDRFFIDWYWVGHTKAWFYTGDGRFETIYSGKCVG